MKTLTPAMLLKALKLFRGFTKAAGEYLRDKERLRICWLRRYRSHKDAVERCCETFNYWCGF